MNKKIDASAVHHFETQYTSIPQLAEFLNVPTNTVRYWVFLKKIPFIKVGRSVRFDMDQIRVWLEERQINEQGGI